MTVHKHVMVLDGSFFACEVCSACVEVVSRVEQVLQGVRVVASVRVRDPGCGGFTRDELGGLSRLWLRIFQHYVDGVGLGRPARPGRRVRRGARWSAPEVVGMWADVSGVDRWVGW
jgi:hypothetical protein